MRGRVPSRLPRRLPVTPIVTRSACLPPGEKGFRAPPSSDVAVCCVTRMSDIMRSVVYDARMLPAAAHVSGDTCAASITPAVLSAVTETLVGRILLEQTNTAAALSTVGAGGT